MPETKSESYEAESYRLEKIADQVEGRVHDKVFDFQVDLDKRVRRNFQLFVVVSAILAVVSVAALYIAYTAWGTAEQAIERIEKIGKAPGAEKSQTGK